MMPDSVELLPGVVIHMLIAASAILALITEMRGPRAAHYVFKPLTTTLILLLALLARPSFPVSYQTLVATGLLLSLAGDVFLMLPQDRFIAGLVSFLVAHLAYVGAFAQISSQMGPVWSSLPFLLILVITLRILLPHTGTLRWAVMVYALVLVTMAWRAFVAWHETNAANLLAAFIGAALFVISDTVLAFNRFVVAFPGARAVILGTYFAAQWLIAGSVY